MFTITEVLQVEVYQIVHVMNSHVNIFYELLAWEGEKFPCNRILPSCARREG